MRKFIILFQGDDVLMSINAINAREARRKFNKQLSFKEVIE